MRLVARRKSDQNEAMIDPWTLVHIGAGLAAGLLGFGLAPAVAAAVGYEVLEQSLERSDGGKKFFKTSGPEHPSNAVFDVVVFAGAWYLGNRWNQT